MKNNNNNTNGAIGTAAKPAARNGLVKKTFCGVVLGGGCHTGNCALWGACPWGKILAESEVKA